MRAALSSFGVGIAILFGSISLLVILLATPDRPNPNALAPGPSNTELEQLVSSLSGELQNLQDQVESLTAIPGDAPVAAHISRLDQTLSRTSERVASLEGAILADPVKAVQLPLLSDQVTDLAERTNAAFAAQRNDVDRVYDILKMSIGGLFVAVMSTAVTTVFRTRKEVSS